MRKDLGQALADYGYVNKNIAVLDADVSNSTMTILFKKEHPDRFFNIGIAEPGMIDTAAGLAMGGKIPFVSAFGALLCYRCLEQIRTCIAYNNSNVKMLSGYAGVSDFKDGPTHHTVFDIAVMRAMPNMTVVIASDGAELKKIIPVIAEYTGPVYLRISRADVPNLFGEDDQIEIGKGRTLKEGSDVTLIATGIALYRTMKAADLLASDGIDAQVVEIHTLKPLDEELILRCAEKTGALVTIEEHSVIGGLFGAVSESLIKSKPVPVIPIGIQDVFACTAPDPDSLWDYCGLRPENIAKVAREILQIKK